MSDPAPAAALEGRDGVSTWPASPSPSAGATHEAGHPREPCPRHRAPARGAPRHRAAAQGPRQLLGNRLLRPPRRRAAGRGGTPRRRLPGGGLRRLGGRRRASRELGMRVLRVRTGVVLDSSGGALEKMLPPFRLGVGGPVAGGRQYMPWVHADDVVGIMSERARGRPLERRREHDGARSPSRTANSPRRWGRPFTGPRSCPSRVPR